MPLEVGKPFIPMGYFGRFVSIPLCLLMFKGISATCKLLWGRIALYLGKNGEAYPSQAKLAKDLDLTKRSVARALKQLVDAGFLMTEPGTGRTATRYHLLFHEIFMDKAHGQPKASPRQTLDWQAGDATGLGVDKNDHPQASRIDKNDHPQAAKGGQVVPLRVDKTVYQKRTISKEQKEKKKKDARELNAEQQEWVRLKLAMDVFNKNLGEHEIKDRKAELADLVNGDSPFGPSLEALQKERAYVEGQIMRIERVVVRETLFRKLEQSLLTKKNLDEFSELSRMQQAGSG